MFTCGSELQAEKGQWLLAVEVGVAGATLSGCRRRIEGFFPQNALTGLSLGFCPKWK